MKVLSTTTNTVQHIELSRGEAGQAIEKCVFALLPHARTVALMTLLPERIELEILTTTIERSKEASQRGG